MHDEAEWDRLDDDLDFLSGGDGRIGNVGIVANSFVPTQTGVLSDIWAAINGAPWSLTSPNFAVRIGVVPEASAFVLMGKGTVGLPAFARQGRR